jgi:hypothetical protein
MNKNDLEIFKSILIDLVKLLLNKNKEIKGNKDV